MTPKLPTNLMTITPYEQGRHLNAVTAHRKYVGRKIDAQTRAEIEDDLEDLRAMDSYECRTDPTREDAKRVLAAAGDELHQRR